MLGRCVSNKDSISRHHDDAGQDHDSTKSRWIIKTILGMFASMFKDMSPAASTSAAGNTRAIHQAVDKVHNYVGISVPFTHKTREFASEMRPLGETPISIL